MKGDQVKKALVTGGSGFLGSHVADQLTSAGIEVTILDRVVSPWLADGQKMIVGDINDEEIVRDATDGQNYVYHLAALSDLARAYGDAVGTVRDNVLGTALLLEAAREAGADRFVLASTVYVYSRAGGFYRCSKRAAETYVEEFQKQHGLSYTVLRYGSLYGPRADSSNGVFRLLQEAVEHGRICHQGTPEDTREYVHVEDAAKLSVEALDPAYENQHLVVTGAHPMPIRDLFTMFSEMLGTEIAIEYLDPGDVPDTHYRVTPYAFTPSVGRKLTTNCYVDMGQGLLQILEQMHGRATREGASGSSSG